MASIKRYFKASGNPDIDKENILNIYKAAKGYDYRYVHNLGWVTDHARRNVAAGNETYIKISIADSGRLQATCEYMGRYGFNEEFLKRNKYILFTRNNTVIGEI